MECGTIKEKTTISMWKSLFTRTKWDFYTHINIFFITYPTANNFIYSRIPWNSSFISSVLYLLYERIHQNSIVYHRFFNELKTFSRPTFNKLNEIYIVYFINFVNISYDYNSLLKVLSTSMHFPFSYYDKRTANSKVLLHLFLIRLLYRSPRRDLLLSEFILNFHLTSNKQIILLFSTFCV